MVTTVGNLEAIPYENGGNTVRVWTGHRLVPPVTGTRKGKGAIPYEPGGKTVRAWRQYRTSMQAIPYEHGQVTGQYHL